MSDFWHYLVIFLLYLFPVFVLVAALCDLRRYQIPNWIPLVIFVLFFPASFSLGWPLDEIGFHLLCFVVTLILGFILFVLKLFGGGDAKLIAAASIWVGWSLLPSFLMLIALFGGVLALVILLFRRLVSAEKIPQISWIAGLHNAKNGIPYAVAIAASVLVLYPKMKIAEQIFLN